MEDTELVLFEENARAYRANIKTDPSLYTGKLIDCLDEMAQKLCENYKFRKALPYIEEMKSIFERNEELCRTRKEQYALCLNLLAICLDYNQEIKSSISCAEDAVSNYRDLYTQNRSLKYCSLLAMNLSNLSNRYRRNGDYRNAIESSQEAVALAKQQQLEDPTTYASSLLSLAMSLNVVGKMEDAAKYYKMSIELLTRIHDRNNIRSNIELAKVLYNYAECIYSSNVQEALNATEQALTLTDFINVNILGDIAYLPIDCGRTYARCLRLIKKVPESLSVLRNMRKKLHSFAKSQMRLKKQADLLCEKADCYADLHEYSKASIALCKAINIVRNINESKENELTLASCLFSLANVYSHMEKKSEVMPLLRESEKIYRKYLVPESIEVKQKLALVLNNLSNELFRYNSVKESFECINEAISIRQELTKSVSSQYNSDLAISLLNLSSHLSTVGDNKKAVLLAQESVSLLELYTPQTLDIKRYLMSAYGNHSNILSELGQHQESRVIATKALSVAKEICEIDEYYLPDYANILGNYANRCYDTKKYEECIACGQEAVTLYRKLAKIKPQEFNGELARVLTNLGCALSEVNQVEAAISCSMEAASIYRSCVTEAPLLIDRYIASLNNYANRLIEINDAERSTVLIDEALSLTDINVYPHLDVAFCACLLTKLRIYESLNNWQNILDTVKGMPLRLSPILSNHVRLDNCKRHIASFVFYYQLSLQKMNLKENYDFISPLVDALVKVQGANNG